jgi:hypothetical protein
LQPQKEAAAGFSADQGVPVAQLRFDELASAIRSATFAPPAASASGVVDPPTDTTHRSASVPLPVYAAAGGSLAVLAGALVALAVPDPWSIPLWIGLAFVLCTAVGLSADKFVK